VALLTITDLISDARELADAETPSPTTDFVTDTELTRVLARAYRKLYAMVLAFDGGMFLWTTSTVLTTPYTLPATFYRYVSAEVPGNGGSPNNWSELKQFPWQERNSYTDLQNPRIRIVGGLVHFAPQDAAPSSVRLWYVPAAPSTASIISSGSVNCPVDGMEDFLIATLAFYVCSKEDRDGSLHQMAREEALAVVASAVKSLEYTEARPIADVSVLPADYDDYSTWR
jgi:hypothetical protein